MAIKGKEELKKLNTLQVKLQSEIEAIKIIKRRVKKIKGRKQGNCFGTRNATLHRKSLGN